MATEIQLTFNFRGRRFRDAQKGLEIFAAQLGKNVSKLPPVLARDLDEYLREVRKALVQRHSKAFVNPTNAPATGEDNLLRRTGGIAGIRTFVKKSADLNRIQGALVVPFPISVHEEGTTIRAKRTQFLTIPLPAALDSRGVPLRARARDWDNTFVARSRRGNLLIFQRQGVGIVPLYLLKREVTLPPRLGAQDTLEAGANFFVDTAIDNMVKKLQEGL